MLQPAVIGKSDPVAICVLGAEHRLMLSSVLCQKKNMWPFGGSLLDRKWGKIDRKNQPHKKRSYERNNIVRVFRGHVLFSKNWTSNWGNSWCLPDAFCFVSLQIKNDKAFEKKLIWRQTVDLEGKLLISRHSEASNASSHQLPKNVFNLF